MLSSTNVIDLEGISFPLISRGQSIELIAPYKVWEIRDNTPDSRRLALTSIRPTAEYWFSIDTVAVLRDGESTNKWNVR